VELTPPSPADIPKITQGIQNIMSSAATGKWKTVPVKVFIPYSRIVLYLQIYFNLQEAWLNTLITAEIAFWFFVGECIGKGSIVGYKV
jgi:F-type H+-transporting ATPase subunit g